MTKRQPTKDPAEQTIFDRYLEIRAGKDVGVPTTVAAILTAAEVIVNRLDGIIDRLQMIEEAVIEKTMVDDEEEYSGNHRSSFP